MDKMNKPTLIIALGKARNKKSADDNSSEEMQENDYSAMMADFDARLSVIEEKLGIEKKEKSKEE